MLNDSLFEFNPKKVDFLQDKKVIIIIINKTQKYRKKYFLFIISILYNMVLTAIADVTLELTFWGAKKVYGLGYWLIWGNPKSETEILLEKQNSTIKMLHDDLKIINKRLHKIEKNQNISNKNNENIYNQKSFCKSDPCEPIEILSNNFNQQDESIE